VAAWLLPNNEAKKPIKTGIDLTNTFYIDYATALTLPFAMAYFEIKKRNFFTEISL